MYTVLYSYTVEPHDGNADTQLKESSRSGSA